jgi:hypothetical protein
VNIQEIEFELYIDLLSNLGYISSELRERDQIIVDTWKFIGGSDSRNISKRAFIVFINALNNVFLPWMTQESNGLIVESEG